MPLAACRDYVLHGLVALFLIITSISAEAQQAPPYDPCLATNPNPCPTAPGFVLCDEYGSYPTSEGYNFGTDANSVTVDGGLASIALCDGTVDGKTIEINGTYVITKRVVFSNCIFKMHGGSKIILQPDPLSGIGFFCDKKIDFEDCAFFSCDEMWWGITTVVMGTNPIFKSSFKCNFTGNRVQDARIGLEVQEGKTADYMIHNNSFSNNHIGIANRLKNGSFLNAVFTWNQFFRAGTLRPKHSSMSPTDVPEHPNAYAGMKLDQVVASVGSSHPGGHNTFSCLTRGISALGSTLNTENNLFTNISDIAGNTGVGIVAEGGSLHVLNSQFSSCHQVCIYATGMNLTILHNTFGGVSGTGISSTGNSNGERILIADHNNFQMTDNAFRNGITLERSIASDPNATSCSILDNDFTVNQSSPLPGEGRCVNVYTFGASSDKMEIARNHAQITATTVNGKLVFHGLYLYLGNAGNYIVHDNTIHYTGQYSSSENWGIAVFNGSSGIFPKGSFYRNSITGQGLDAAYCSFHTEDVVFAEFCENMVDNIRNGFHFYGTNQIEFRENKMNHHQLGVWIQGSMGKQGIDAQGNPLSRGNQWSSNANDCTVSAARATGSSPLFSEFNVSESTILPYLPPNNKIDPDPTAGTNWFHYEVGALPDYCIPPPPPNPPGNPPAVDRLAEYEQREILGISELSGVAHWDMQRNLYTKLLLTPSLRPSGSAEEAYFNGLSGTVIASFAQVEQLSRNALVMSAGQQSQLDAARTTIVQQWSEVRTLDSLQNFSNPTSLDSTFFDQRDSLLTLIAVADSIEHTVEIARNQQVSAGLQNVLTANTNITTVQTWETARKQANTYLLNHLMGQPATSVVYQQWLALAQQDKATHGQAVSEAIALLVPCDQAQLVGEESEEEERPSSGLHQHTLENSGLVAVPNPARDVVSIRLPSGFTVGTLRVYDAYGRLVIEQAVPQGAKTVGLNCGALPSGLYRVALFDFNTRSIVSCPLSLIP